jgi:putative transposase
VGADSLGMCLCRSVAPVRYGPAAMRYTTFRLSLDPTPAQEQLLARWAGASRFAYNQSLRLVTDALAAKRVDPSVTVPWSGLDLINAFNAWKKSEAAGRIFVVALDGTVAKHRPDVAA